LDDRVQRCGNHLLRHERTAYAEVRSAPGSDARRPSLNSLGHDLRMATTYPKYQNRPHCGQQVPTQWERHGNEVELPGTHECPKGHMFLT
jgi:hypothetical protein